MGLPKGPSPEYFEVLVVGWGVRGSSNGPVSLGLIGENSKLSCNWKMRCKWGSFLPTLVYGETPLTTTWVYDGAVGAKTERRLPASERALNQWIWRCFLHHQCCVSYRVVSSTGPFICRAWRDAWSALGSEGSWFIKRDLMDDWIWSMISWYECFLLLRDLRNWSSSFLDDQKWPLPSRFFSLDKRPIRQNYDDRILPSDIFLAVAESFRDPQVDLWKS